MTRNCLAAWFVLAGISLPLLTGVAPASAQAIPPAVKSSTSADQIRPSVRAFVSEQAARLKSTDAGARAAARDALIDEAEVSTAAGGVAGNQVSAAYRDIYARELNTELLEVMKEAPLETRINAAIVAARVAPRDISAQLEGVARAALADTQDPVTLWGLKAAAQLLPASLNFRPTNNALLAAVSEAAMQNADTALIVDAYDALTLTSYSADARQLRDLIPEDRWRKLVPLVFPDLIRLWTARLELYAGSASINPSAERIPALFVGNLRTWPALAGPQQVQAMQMMVNQLSLAGDRANASAGEKDLFVNSVYRPTAGAISVIGQAENAEAIVNAGRAGSGISGSTVATAIEQATTNIINAVKSSSKFSSLKPPPEVQEQASTPTTSTTRPGG